MTLTSISKFPVSPPTSFELAPATTMNIRDIDDALRLLAGLLRSFSNEAAEGFIEYGDGDGEASYTYVSGTQFKVGGSDQSTAYPIGRRVKATGTSTGTIYGNITAVSYSAPDTTVTVAWDSGSLQNDTDLRILVGPQFTNAALPHKKSVSSASGYIQVPLGGFLWTFQWVGVTVLNGAGAANFPITFPTECLWAVPMTPSTTTRVANCHTITASSAQVKAWDTSDSSGFSSSSFKILAFGY